MLSAKNTCLVVFLTILGQFAVQEVHTKDSFAFFLKDIEENEEYKIPNFLKFVREKLEEFVSVSKQFDVYEETVEFYQALYNLIFKPMKKILRLMIRSNNMKIANEYDDEYRKVFMRLKDLSNHVSSFVGAHKDKKELFLLYPFYLGIQVFVDAIPLATDTFFLPVD